MLIVYYPYFCVFFLFFSGGNQRDLARQKNQKKQQDQKKSAGAGAKEGNKGLTLEERKHRLVKSMILLMEKLMLLLFLNLHNRDAEMMRLKQQKAMEKKETQAS